MASFETNRKTSVSSGISFSLSSTKSNHLRSKPTVITPRIQEAELGESLKFRTGILPELRELGPPDLIHLSKYDKTTKQETGEYHYAVGLNTSSVIQPYMYLQTIQVNDKHRASDKHPKIGTYCSYNCFSKGDIRIRCTFPSSTGSMVQFMPTAKNKVTVSINTEDPRNSLLWLETWVSSLIRSVIFSDNVERLLPGMCLYNPIQSTKDTKEALTAMISLIPKGNLVGSKDLINQCSIINNYLIDAIFSILEITGYYDHALQELERLDDTILNLNVLKVRLLFAKGDQTKAIKTIYELLKEDPRDGWLLLEQAKFLISQDRSDLATLPAIRAVECLPTEFECWRVLIEAYILNKDFQNALLALNSAPMYSNKKKDIYMALKPNSFNFPLPLEGKLSDVWKNCDSFGYISGFGGIVEFSPSYHIDSTSPTHIQIYEQTKLQCTFKEAYNLMAIMARQLGWAELLRLRSTVFVMEDEYNQSVLFEQQKEQKELQQSQNLTPPTYGSGSRSRSLSITSKNGSSVSISRISSKFKTKRLSERWLDSLFLIFYENLKSALIWANERSNADDITSLQHIPLEWELIGEECMKVHHYEQAIVPMKTCLDNRFSIFAAHDLLNYYLEYTERDLEFRKLNSIKLNFRTRKDKSRISSYALPEDFVLKLVCKLVSWNYRYYGEFSLLSFKVLKTLVESEDAIVIKSKLETFFVEEDADTRHSIVGLVDRFISWLQQFHDV